MNYLWNKIKFYYEPLAIITFLNVIYLFFIGTYFEDYEGIFSALIQGVYTKPATAWWDVTNHFLILYIYEIFVKILPDYNVYGIILFIYNWICLSVAGLVLYRVLKVNLLKYSIPLFILLYSILTIDTFVNLNSTRQAFIFTAIVFSYIESRRFEGKILKFNEWVWISFFMFFISLLRFEAALLFTLIYTFIIILHNRFIKWVFIPLILSGLVFFSNKVLITNHSSEAKKVFIYKERQIFDRDNIDYKKITEAQKLDVKAITEYGIIDKENFTLRFYDSISKYKSSYGISYLLDGFNLDSFITAFENSIIEFYLARYYILFFILSAFYMVFQINVKKKKFVFQVLSLFALPILMCFITIVPLRFLAPYFSILGVLNILTGLQKASKNASIFILLTCILVSIIMVFNAFEAKKKYVEDTIKYRTITQKLLILNKDQADKKPIIIHNFFDKNYFPIRPLDRLSRQNALFLNFYFFTTEDFIIESWKNVCECNPLSVKEKVDYVVSNKNLFLIDDKSFSFMFIYFKSKYGIELYRTQVSRFDNELKVCKLNYKNTSN